MTLRFRAIDQFSSFQVPRGGISDWLPRRGFEEAMHFYFALPALPVLVAHNTGMSTRSSR